ncbi:unnamed protein product [Medioppia subpectinata]|uniref:Uncharacterized protein n=1 Tax=Medioppia subpectinata TaxID=1979941 RepID=A0A7R9Q869_9ACAR|nr:unnamed protein product [Medioppia subpectinata]CAG2115032.1 unnamed protein product [Medioppia subpectinata]
MGRKSNVNFKSVHYEEVFIQEKFTQEKLHLIVSLSITFVVCDRKADIQCLKEGSNDLKNKTEQQLYDLSQTNLEIGQELVLKRADIANSEGLTCYYQFYQNYTQGLANIFMKQNEINRLNTSRTPDERAGAVKGIASITKAMRCDESWRAIHFNETINEAKCSRFETAFGLDLIQFKPKLALLETGLGFGDLALKFKNNVMSGIVGDISKLFGKVYTEAEKCSLKLTNPKQSCHNLKMFVKEIDRLFYLAEIGVLALF